LARLGHSSLSSKQERLTQFPIYGRADGYDDFFRQRAGLYDAKAGTALRTVAPG